MPTDSTSLNETQSSTAAYAGELVKAAFAADTYCLGPHWIYDLSEIARLYPNGLSELDQPRSKYHGAKAAGDFTHHGDQSLVLLESLANRGSFTQAGWRNDFAAYWQSEPRSYFDGAARETLENLSSGRIRPSGSEDLAGVSRAAPLLALLASDPIEVQVEKIRELVEVTHGHPAVADAGEFFARAIGELKNGKSYSEAFSAALETGSYSVSISEYVRSAEAALGGELEEVAQSLGQSCSTSKAFPLTIWLALKYGDDPVKMLEANALAGGDNSARGMILGILLAARGEFSKLPESWTTQQRQRDRIDSLLAKLKR